MASCVLGMNITISSKSLQRLISSLVFSHDDINIEEVGNHSSKEISMDSVISVLIISNKSFHVNQFSSKIFSRFTRGNEGNSHRMSHLSHEHSHPSIGIRIILNYGYN